MLGNTINSETDSKSDTSENYAILSYTNGTANQFDRIKSSSSSSLVVTDSESSDTDRNYVEGRAQVRRTELPPIGVFWDIENCQVPKDKSAVGVVQLIRNSFFTGYREAEFLVVCDVRKENSHIMQELNDAQVTLVHVQSTCKNAADEKLRQALRRFGDIHGAPAAVILISGDINFAADLSDLRHRKKIHVILVHKSNTADALILCASEHYNYTEITQVLPAREVKTSTNGRIMEVLVSNLPQGYELNRLRNRLRQLSDNCGGRIVFISLQSCVAVLRFRNGDLALRYEFEELYTTKCVYENTLHSTVLNSTNFDIIRFINFIMKADPNIERGIRVRYALQNDTLCYKYMYTDKKKKKIVQSTLFNYFLK